MTSIAPQLKKALLKIIRDDYQRCEFLTAASGLLVQKIHAIEHAVELDRAAFEALRDSIGELGLTISTIEKRLEEAEECYSRLIDALAEHKPESEPDL